MNRPNPVLVSALACLLLQACGTAPTRFGEERARLDAASAALAASDYPAARSEAAAAIDLLLARAEEERDAGWVALLERAGLAALGAQDAPAAARAFEEVHRIRVRDLPEDHPDLQRARLNLAVAISDLGRLDEARSLQEAALAVDLRTLPQDHPDLQGARQGLGATLFQLGEWERARELFAQVLAVRESTLTADDPDLQAARGNLASTLNALGDSRGARELDEKVLEVFSRTLPADHPHLQSARANRADDLYALGDFDGARQLQEAVLEVLSRTRIPDDLDLQTARLNLARTFSALGDYGAARALEEQALAVLSRTMPPDHPDLQRARGNLAGALHALGDFDGARALQEAVLEVFSRTRPADHPDLEWARENLAASLVSLGEFEAALSLAEQVVEGLSRTRPQDDRSLLHARLTLAAALHELDRPDDARVQFEQVLEGYLLSSPEDDPGVLLARGNLALSLLVLGELDRARTLAQQQLEICSRTRPEGHPDLRAAQSLLAETLSRTAAVRTVEEGGDEGAARAEWRRSGELMLAVTRAQTEDARKALSEGSPREAQARCMSLADELGPGLSFADGFGLLEPIPELDRALFVLSETTRGAALGSAALMRRAAGSPRYLELRERLHEQADEIARRVQTGTTSEEFRSALARQEEAERELVDVARELSGGSLPGLDFDAGALSAKLDENEGVVGLRRYTHTRAELLKADGSTVTALESRRAESLCAFVLRRGELTRVELGPIAPIEEAVHDWRESLGAETGARGVKAARPMPAPERIDETGARLRELVFDPLLPALGGASHVIFALDDVLHLVPLDALPAGTEKEGAPGEGPLLGDRWRIETRSTLAELLAPPPPPGSADLLVALGGASFSSPPLALAAEDAPAIETSAGLLAAAAPAGSGASLLRGGAWELGFEPLSNTDLEAREIAALHDEWTGTASASLVLAERQASRAALEELAPRARWLHLATHGWFAPESIPSWSDVEPVDPRAGLGMPLSSEQQVRRMSPMLLCGLALAGANLPPDATGAVPGLVTADVLSTLDLANCELVVLSACDTNVGERHAGQGVASLQKAMQMAGARSVITSLWKVPDEATRSLMVDFYRRLWVEKKPKRQALWEAKTRIRNEKDEAGRFRYTTRDWAAWVLTGDPD